MISFAQKLTQEKLLILSNPAEFTLDTDTYMTSTAQWQTATPLIAS